MKEFINRALFCLAILVISVYATTNIYSQNVDKTDSIKVVKHSPKKATLYALVPGLGQIYNKKYWKLPIVYAGFAVTGYFAMWNRGKYLDFHNAYICEVNNPTDCDNPLAIKYTADELKTYRDAYRRDMEFSFILMGVWYVLQILDATVDAHLYHWEVNENLSVRAEPVFQQSILPTPGLMPHNNINHNGLKITVKF